jgi:lipoyl(octanoyl) transferase
VDIRHLGEVPYLEALALQRALHQQRVDGEIGDTVLLLTHPHTLTAGTRSGKTDRWFNLRADRAALTERGVALVEVDRGGDVTYHGPGQIVAYPIVHLDAFPGGVSAYVRRLEAVMIRTCNAVGITAARLPGYPGAWVGDAKLGAIGARVRRQVTMHGFALNLMGPLEGFAWIVACGLDGKSVTSVERQLPAGGCPTWETLEALVEDALRATFIEGAGPPRMPGHEPAR